MKKNRIQKITAQVKRNTKTAIKEKKRIKSRIKHTPEYITTWGPGPSKAIKYGKDGKVIRFLKWAGNKKQHTYTTEVARNAKLENKQIKENKKKIIKAILQKAGYDPTIKYTRKEARKFTRIVKKELFTVDKMRSYLKEMPLKTYQYKIERFKDSKPNASEAEKTRTYVYAKDKVEAYTHEGAVLKLAEVARKWTDDSSFAGISVLDPDTGHETYYSHSKWAA